jgi:hypothetical protein
MANMQKEGLKGECPYGFTQLSVRSQDMAVLLHRMKQLNELDHTDVWNRPSTWFESDEQKRERENDEAVQKARKEKEKELYEKYKKHINSYEYKRDFGDYRHE